MQNVLLCDYYLSILEHTKTAGTAKRTLRSPPHTASRVAAANEITNNARLAPRPGLSQPERHAILPQAQVVHRNRSERLQVAHRKRSENLSNQEGVGEVLHASVRIRGTQQAKELQRAQA